VIFPAPTNLLPCSSAYNRHVDRIVIADQLLLLHKIAFIHGVVAAPFCGLRIPVSCSHPISPAEMRVLRILETIAGVIPMAAAEILK
jgi:hypothetical protein